MRRLLAAVLCLCAVAGRAAAENDLSAEERAAGWRLLFDGKTTTGWMSPKGKPLPESHVQAGALNPHPCDYMLVWGEALGDFELVLEFKLSPKCNSGIFVRTSPLEPRPGKDVGFNGIEIALDDTTTAGYHDTGAIYDLVAPRENRMKPAGEWNAARIVSRGSRLEVSINGAAVTAIVATTVVVASATAASRPIVRGAVVPNIVLVTPCDLAGTEPVPAGST